MDPSKPKEEYSMEKLTSNISPHILDIPQHKPLFDPSGFWGFLGRSEPPVFYPV